MPRWRSIARLVLGASLLSNACTHDASREPCAAAGGAGDSAGSGEDSAGAPALGDAGAAGNAHGDGGAPFEAGAAGSSEAGAGAAVSAGDGGESDAPDEPPPFAASCRGLPRSCGPDQATSCCAASLVPGGSYYRSNQPSAPAQIGPFLLDDYEVTLGRFRHFIAAYSQSMTPAGSGKNSLDLDSSTGWNSLWNARLPASPDALRQALQCPSATYTPTPGANENQPITCVSWYEAYAFCIWDGGRLPSEAEWNFAAAGGIEERTYPWGSAAPNDSLAVFCPASCRKMQAVGSRAPSGNAKWGQADLAGNAWEWTLDVLVNPYPTKDCDNCAFAPADSAGSRVFRGGSSGNDASILPSANRYGRDPRDHNGFIGVRCARNVSR